MAASKRSATEAGAVMEVPPKLWPAVGSITPFTARDDRANACYFRAGSREGSVCPLGQLRIELQGMLFRRCPLSLRTAAVAT
jgi:hypothetical protein